MRLARLLIVGRAHSGWRLLACLVQPGTGSEEKMFSMSDPFYNSSFSARLRCPYPLRSAESRGPRPFPPPPRAVGPAEFRRYSHEV